jgi:hypothetical protein
MSAPGAEGNDRIWRRVEYILGRVWRIPDSGVKLPATLVGRITVASVGNGSTKGGGCLSRAIEKPI